MKEFKNICVVPPIKNEKGSQTLLKELKDLETQRNNIRIMYYGNNVIVDSMKSKSFMKSMKEKVLGILTS